MTKPNPKRSPNQAAAFGMKLGFSKAQASALARLTTPARIQDYINAIPINFEPDGDTCLPAAEALRQNRAHCIEAAFIASATLWMHGQPPLMMDLTAKGDDDHVVALFRQRGCWGAISKSNHVWLRWRDPIYRSLRELALSYFHEYVSKRSKTLWSYSIAFDLRRFDPAIWIAGSQSCFEVAGALDDIRHYPLVTPAQMKNLRHRDPIELRAGKLLDYETKDQKAAKRY